MTASRARAAGDPRIAEAARTLGIGAPRATPLTGGSANTAIRLRGGGLDVVVRLSGPRSAALGAAAGAEIAMQGLAARAGLAPEILLAWPDRGVLVTRYVPGDRPGAQALREPAWIARVGHWLAALHGQAPPPGLEAIDFGGRAAGYLATLCAAGDGPASVAIATALESKRAAIAPPARLVACHHDLHHRNLVLTARGLLALDWEYAGPGDPAADLAAFVRYHDLDGAALARLLAAYGAGGPALGLRVEALAWIFDCLWYGWLGVAALSGLADVRKRRAALAARLMR